MGRESGIGPAQLTCPNTGTDHSDQCVPVLFAPLFLEGRHAYATRLRQGGADPAQVQALLGHASIDTAARYFRSGTAENAA